MAKNNILFGKRVILTQNSIMGQVRGLLKIQIGEMKGVYGKYLVFYKILEIIVYKS